MSKLSAVTYVHFACHGQFDPLDPLASALLLAGPDRLTLRDLLDGQLDLRSVDLAVLSACQTGIGDYRDVPDESLGLATGFLVAGVSGVNIGS